MEGPSGFRRGFGRVEARSIHGAVLAGHEHGIDRNRHRAVPSWRVLPGASWSPSGQARAGVRRRGLSLRLDPQCPWRRSFSPAADRHTHSLTIITHRCQDMFKAVVPTQLTRGAARSADREFVIPGPTSRRWPTPRPWTCARTAPWRATTACAYRQAPHRRGERLGPGRRLRAGHGLRHDRGLRDRTLQPAGDQHGCHAWRERHTAPHAHWARRAPWSSC
jgi:hypothetical protein